MIEGRGDHWLAAAGVWLMIFVTGQGLILFLTEVFVSDQRVACWLASSGRPWFADLPIELCYLIAFGAIIIGVGLFRLRTMIQDKIRHRLNEFADDLSQQVFGPEALDAIGKAGRK